MPYLAHGTGSRGAQISRAQQCGVISTDDTRQSTQLGSWERLTQRLTRIRGYRQWQEINCGKFSLHSKVAEGGIFAGLQSGSLWRSIFYLPKWSLLVVICHKPHPHGREMKFCEFRTDPHSLACWVHISLWMCTPTTRVFWRKHCTDVIWREYLWLSCQLFWTQGIFLVLPFTGVLCTDNNERTLMACKPCE